MTMDKNDGGGGEGRTIRISGVKFDKPVGKGYYRRADGSIEKENLLAARAEGGSAITESFKTAAEAFSFRQNVDCMTMLFSGAFLDGKAGALALSQKGLEGVHGHLEPEDWGNVVGLTGDHLAHREGGGLLPIDIDFKRADEVAALDPPTPIVLAFGRGGPRGAA